MANIIDIYSSKFSKEKLVENNNFYNSEDEITQTNTAQQKYISNINYYAPSNFARFGSAEEYYKNAINYINTSFPYNSCTEEKTRWINSLNEFEYHIYNNEYPRSLGYCNLSGTQYINIFSHIKNVTEDTKDSYRANYKYDSNRRLSLDDGITFESWIKFNSDEDSSIFGITAITSSAPSLNDPVPLSVFSIIRDTSGPIPRFVLNEGVYGSGSYAFQTNIQRDEWHHYSFIVKSESAKLFIDGQLVEELKDINLLSSNEFIFAPGGLIFLSTAQTAAFNTINFTIFNIGNGNFSLDETRFWNTARSVEKVGRYWFTGINGNDFSDPNNSSLLFYYKFNEGWDPQYQFLCLDYSGYDNDGEITDYTTDCRYSGSAINDSGFVRVLEAGDIIYKGLSYSQDVKDFYSVKIQSGVTHDENNMHCLYKKFPSWILEQEEENETKQLKQIIQIVSYYFDDLYNKIKEVTNYKAIKHGQSKEKIYPFYDKILASTGFDFSELFTNLDIIEKISSRSDTEVFEQEVHKIKNAIFQNIYNNLSYILKSKGTEKSFKSLLSSYGISENLVRINLYADNTEYNIVDKSKESVVKKKTVVLNADNSIYLSSSAINEDSDLKYYTLETSFSLPSKFYQNSAFTSSLFGIQNNIFSGSSLSGDNNYEYSVYIENNPLYGSRFILSGSNAGIASSSYHNNLFDDSIWNLAIRKKPDIDIVYGTSSVPDNIFELYGVNTNSDILKEFSCSLAPQPNIDGFLRYYVGAKKTHLTGSTICQARSKFLYCNFWSDYLTSEVITSHNKDILNYGVDE